MKWIGMHLLVLLSLAGGCAGGAKYVFTPAKIAGVYQFTKFTVQRGDKTTVHSAPDISGTLSLTSHGTYEKDLIYSGSPFKSSGTFVISGSSIVLTMSGNTTSVKGAISDGGRKITTTETKRGATGFLEFTRS